MARLDLVKAIDHKGRQRQVPAGDPRKEETEFFVLPGDGDQWLKVPGEEKRLGLPDHVAPCEGVGAEVLPAEGLPVDRAGVAGDPQRAGGGPAIHDVSAADEKRVDRRDGWQWRVVWQAAKRPAGTAPRGELECPRRPAEADQPEERLASGQGGGGQRPNRVGDQECGHRFAGADGKTLPVHPSEKVPMPSGVSGGAPMKMPRASARAREPVTGHHDQDIPAVIKPTR